MQWVLAWNCDTPFAVRGTRLGEFESEEDALAFAVWLGLDPAMLAVFSED